MYDDDENSIEWGSTFRLQNRKPFTSLDGVVVDPDVVIFNFCLPDGTSQEFTWTNGATPPDPTYTIMRKVVSITAVTPSDPATGSVLYETSTAHNYWPGKTITIVGVSPSGYSGVFQVATVPSATTFTVVNATTGVATLTSATSTETGVFYMDIDSTVFMPVYVAGTWNFWVQGKPGVSGLDLTKTNVRYNGNLFVNGPDC